MFAKGEIKLKPRFLTFAVAHSPFCDTGKICYYKHRQEHGISTMPMEDPTEVQGFRWAGPVLSSQ
jgi:hypothetical protein